MTSSKSVYLPKEFYGKTVEVIAFAIEKKKQKRNKKNIA